MGLYSSAWWTDRQPASNIERERGREADVTAWQDGRESNGTAATTSGAPFVIELGPAFGFRMYFTPPPPREIPPEIFQWLNVETYYPISTPNPDPNPKMIQLTRFSMSR